MAKKGIVIDASLARSAGTSEHPRSSRARRFIETVREACHTAVFTPSLMAEWRKHQSGFARIWLTQMYSRKKVKLIEPLQNEALRKGLSKAVQNPDNPEEQASNERAIEKDCHLIEAALDTDKIIASFDGKAQRLFARACQRVHEIRRIMWVLHDESEPIEAVLTWLKTGAPERPERQLSHFSEE